MYLKRQNVLISKGFTFDLTLWIIHAMHYSRLGDTTKWQDDHVRNNGPTADLLPSSYSLTVHVCDKNINMFVYTRNSEHNSLLIPRLRLARLLTAPTRSLRDVTETGSNVYCASTTVDVRNSQFYILPVSRRDNNSSTQRILREILYVLYMSILSTLNLTSWRKGKNVQ